MLVNGSYWIREIAQPLSDEFSSQGFPIKAEEIDEEAKEGSVLEN
jgi:hypothetical protein